MNRRWAAALVAALVALPASEGRAQTETSTASAAPASMPAMAPEPPPRPPRTPVDHQAQLNAFRVRIDALRSKLGGVSARIAGLKQTALSGVVAPTRGQLVHKNEMSGNFRLEKVTYSLDGAVIFSQDDGDGTLSDDRIVLFDGPLTAGAHAVEVQMVFKGASLGVFTYLQGYKFNIRSRYQFDVVEGRNNVLSIVAYEAEDITAEAKDRFKVRYDVEVNDDVPRPVAP